VVGATAGASAALATQHLAKAVVTLAAAGGLAGRAEAAKQAHWLCCYPRKGAWRAYYALRLAVLYLYRAVCLWQNGRVSYPLA